jgi:hypothetical protein
VTLDGIKISDWSYYPDTLTTVIRVPARDKRQPLTVRATARGTVSALGMKRDRRALHADLYRLLGNRLTSDVWAWDELRDAVLNLDGPGWADALARVGGPLVHTLEYVTPEEAALRLGHVVVGAPADGTPYDLAATFTFDRGDQTERRTLALEELTGSQIIDVPFAFDGLVEAARWQAEVAITWRGRTLTTAHRSRPLFPSVTRWRVAFFDQDAVDTLDGLVDEGSAVNTRGWKTCSQPTDDLRNLNQPHVVFLSREVGDRLRAGERLVAALATTVVSPEPCDAVIIFPPSGSITIYLNGEQVQEAPAEADTASQLFHHPFRQELRRTAVIQLRRGPNELVVHSRPPRSEGEWWIFGAAVLAPDGEVMTGLAFS